MKIERRQTLDQRISRACEYISRNLDADLTLETLSAVSALSKFHFHRVFFACTGLNISKFIQMARLKQASFQLAFKNDPKIIDIALDAGFDSPEAFSRAFKREFEQTPSQFKKAPDWPLWHSKFQFSAPKGTKTMDVKTVTLPDIKTAILEHHGSPDNIYDTAAKFVAWRKESKLSPVETSQTYGIPYSDPKLTKPEEFRFDFCGTIEKDVPKNNYNVKTGCIPGGRFAVIRHFGSHNEVEDSIYYLYREWLPQNREEARDFPCFFHYLNFIHEVAEHELVTDIYLPLK